MINIDNRALIHNAEYFQTLIKPTKLCAVLKCDAYGHGLVTCATLLSDSVQYFALSSVAEADSVRHIGVPVLILLPLDQEDTQHAVDNNYCITVDSINSAKLVAQYGNRAKVHIKVDSGMCRLGVNRDDIYQVLDILVSANVDVVGIFSHCAKATNEQYTDMQLINFLACCNITQCMLGYMPLRHFANTDAALTNSRYHLDMVRIGLGLYGYGNSSLVPVKSVSGRVLAVKAVAKGSLVGYDNTYCVPSPTNIAVVDVGYWHGLFQNITTVTINNIPMKVIGRVCMGMLMVDIGKNMVKQFDEVAIIGNNNGIPYSSDISIYELLCATKDTTR